MTHKSRDWHAVETTDLVGSKNILTVTGEFESSHEKETAALKEAVPQGTNPAILILELTIASHGAGGAHDRWRHVTPFVKSVASQHYTEVTIRGGGHDHTVPVEYVPS